MSNGIDISQYIAYLISLFGILAGTFFKMIREMRNKVCLDYENRRRVFCDTVNEIFINRISRHIDTVLIERKKKGVKLKDIYGRPESVAVMDAIANEFKKTAKINMLYKRLLWVTAFAEYVVWASIVSALIFTVIKLRDLSQFSGIAQFPNTTKLLGAVTITGIVAYVVLYTVALVVDGQFFRLANSVIEPEEDNG